MGKRWLTIIGAICVFIALIIGISETDYGYGLILTVIGVALGFVIIALGEILYHLKNGENNKKD